MSGAAVELTNLPYLTKGFTKRIAATGGAGTVEAGPFVDGVAGWDWRPLQVIIGCVGENPTSDRTPGIPVVSPSPNQMTTFQIYGLTKVGAPYIRRFSLALGRQCVLDLAPFIDFRIEILSSSCTRPVFANFINQAMQTNRDQRLFLVELCNVVPGPSFAVPPGAISVCPYVADPAFQWIVQGFALPQALALGVTVPVAGTLYVPSVGNFLGFWTIEP